VPGALPMYVEYQYKYVHVPGIRVLGGGEMGTRHETKRHVHLQYTVHRRKTVSTLITG
jgi:hypothetical protein